MNITPLAIYGAAILVTGTQIWLDYNSPYNQCKREWRADLQRQYDAEMVNYQKQRDYYEAYVAKHGNAQLFQDDQKDPDATGLGALVQDGVLEMPKLPERPKFLSIHQKCKWKR